MHINTLIHGDCVQVLPKVASESVDFILTDPPYLVSYRPRDGRSVIPPTISPMMTRTMDISMSVKPRRDAFRKRSSHPVCNLSIVRARA
jgi:DNA modification methylase